MLLLPGNPTGHNPKLIDQLIRLDQRLENGSSLPLFDFVHLNSADEKGQVFDRCVEYDRDSYVIKLGLGNLSSELGTCFHPLYCCGQFMVTREAILRRPLVFYRLALKAVTEAQDCSGMEHSWHAVFRFERQFSGKSIDNLFSVDEFSAYRNMSSDGRVLPSMQVHAPRSV